MKTKNNNADYEKKTKSVVSKAIVDMVLKRIKNKKIKNEARIEHGPPVW
jgi:hypothetical protein